MSLIHSALAILGLTKRESDVYIAVLQLWTVTVTKIARLVELHRVTTYSVLKRLVDEWIVFETKKWKVTRYSAIEPTKLQAKMDIAYQTFQNAVPELVALTDKFHKPSVAYYEWFEWLRSLYEDILSSPLSIYSFMWVEYIHEWFKYYLEEEFTPLRAKKNIFVRTIAPKTPEMISHQALDTLCFRETILIDKPSFAMHNEIILYDTNKIAVALFSKNELSWLCITSESLYQSLLWIFQLVYDAYKK